MGLETHTDYPMGAWDIHGVGDTLFVLWGCQWRLQQWGLSNLGLMALVFLCVTPSIPCITKGCSSPYMYLGGALF